MQEGTVQKYVADGDNRTLTIRTKNGGRYTHRLDPTCKVTVTPTGTINDVVEGDAVQFSGQPALEVIIHREHVASVRQATPASATVGRQLAEAHLHDGTDDDDEDEMKTPHRTTAPPMQRKHK